MRRNVPSFRSSSPRKCWTRHKSSNSWITKSGNWRPKSWVRWRWWEKMQWRWRSSSEILWRGKTRIARPVSRARGMKSRNLFQASGLCSVGKRWTNWSGLSWWERELRLRSPLIFPNDFLTSPFLQRFFFLLYILYIFFLCWILLNKHMYIFVLSSLPVPFIAPVFIRSPIDLVDSCVNLRRGSQWSFSIWAATSGKQWTC